MGARDERSANPDDKIVANYKRSANSDDKIVANYERSAVGVILTKKARVTFRKVTLTFYGYKTTKALP